MAVVDAHVFLGFFTPVQLAFRNHQLLFSYASAEVRRENWPESLPQPGLELKPPAHEYDTLSTEPHGYSSPLVIAVVGFHQTCIQFRTFLRLSLFFDIPSITNIFCRYFLSSHASHPLQTLYGALARSPTHCLPNSGPPVIYFLFFDLVYCPTLHCKMANFCRTLQGYTK